MVNLSQLWTTERIWQVPPGWRQGRGAWGGLVAGQVVTAATADLPDPRPAPRSLWIAMLGPVLAGEVLCEVRDLRRGRATLAREVTLTGPDDDLLTRAVVVFGVPRAGTAVADVAPGAPDPQPEPGAQRVELPTPPAPEFASQLVFSPVAGFPFSGARNLLATGWISLGEESTDTLTPAVIAALADAWWTVSITGIDGAALGPEGIPPVATLDFSLSFPCPPARPEPGAAVAAEPTSRELWQRGLWHIGRGIAGQQGYLTESRELWTPDGRLLALNSQVIAVGRAG